MSTLDARQRRVTPGERQYPSSALPRVPLSERSVLDAVPDMGGSALDVLVEEIAGLQPLSPIAAQVLQIAEGEHFSAHELAQAISSDPALTARVLRVANSPFFEFPRRITTVRDAVVLLGFCQVRSTVLAASVIQSMPPSSPGDDGLDTATFWRHALTVGQLAALGARADGVHHDEAFPAGVLHNVGRLALNRARPDEFRRARRTAARSGVPLAEVERDVFGFTDSELGGALAMRWQFPANVAMAIARHTDSSASPCSRDPLTGAVAEARQFAARRGMTDGIDDPPWRSSGPSSTYAAAMSIMSPADLPQTAAPTRESASLLGTLVEEQGGLELVTERATVFVEHAATGPWGGGSA